MKVTQVKIESAYDMEHNRDMKQIKVFFVDGSYTMLIMAMGEEASFIAEGFSKLSDAVALKAGARA